MNMPVGGGAGPKGQIRNATTATLITLVTCGLYWVYIFYFQILPELKANLGKSDDELNPMKELIIALICGPYQFLTLMKAGKLIQEAQQRAGKPGEDKGTMFLIMAIVFFPAVPYMMISELNKAWE